MELSLFCASSSSSFNTTPLKYDVFLSFRGEDTRNNFTSHLHRALCDKKIETFIDYELRRGDEISPSLIKAIEDSHISIIIFSEGYASSTWCLEELMNILRCKKKYGQIVIPIFYEVDPSHVRKQTGSFEHAFGKHEQRFRESMDRVQRWRDALKEAAELSGLDSRVIKPESVLIDAIVKDVLKRLNDLSSSDTSNLVGIDSRIQEIESLLCLGSNDVCSVGLWGMGGIGKTTLAKAVFEKISGQFEGSCFIEDVREKSEQCGGLDCLRQKLLSDVLGDADAKMGSTFTKNRIHGKKILVVFDDVTSFKQIKYLIEDFGGFGSGSRVLVTTRDNQVLTNYGVPTYKVNELCYQDAIKLFCLRAFRQNRPIVEYEELSNMILEHIGGIPLALEVFGSMLLGRRKKAWEDTVNKLKKILDNDIHKKLKISYDGLDDNQQNIFLDIACFFKGWDIDFVKHFLHASGFHKDIELSVLADKSLITITKDTITMHDLLQAMGREIVRQESVDDCGKRSRLWHHEDIYHVLTTNTGTESIVGISLDMSKSRNIFLDPCAFVKMRKLRFLNFYSSWYGENKVYAFQGLECFLSELRYLQWYGCPLKSLQSNLHSESFVVLEMPHSNVEQLWNGVQRLVHLKRINLGWSKHLKSLPDLSEAPNLEELNLIGCKSLVEIPPSIQYLTKIENLCLEDCESLMDLPNLSRMTSLETLDLIRCSSLKLLREMPCNMKNLNLHGTAIEELPSSIEHLSGLESLDLIYCSRLRSLPISICTLKSLDFLRLSGCSKLDKLPDDIGNLENLTYLKVKGTAIKELPSSIASLNNLCWLSFQGSKVQDITGLLLPAFLGFPSLVKLNLTDCGILKLPENLDCLSSLEYLYLGINNFESLPASIINLSKLEFLDLRYCTRLRFLPELLMVSTEAYNCTSLEVIPCLSNPDIVVTKDYLRLQFDFINCFKLVQDVLRGSVQVALRNMQRMATLWKEKYIIDKVLPRKVAMCFPGSEVPELFSFVSMESVITMELPMDWFNDNFVGFALCAVVEFQDRKLNVESMAMVCNYKLKSDTNSKHRCFYVGPLSGIDFHKGACYIESDHVYMWFDFEMYSRDIGDNDEVTFEFYITDYNDKERAEGFKVKKCGVLPMYTQYHGESIRSFSSVQEETEPHPKKLKLMDSMEGESN